MVTPAGLTIINDRAAGFFVIDEDAQEYDNKVPSTSDSMVLGSTTGADSNDPALYSAFDRGNIRINDAGNDNYFSVPDESALDITGDIDIRVEVALDEYNTGASQDLMSKFRLTGNQRSWLLRVNSSGYLQLFWSPTGAGITGATSPSSTVRPSTVFADGERGWLRATLDVDNGSSQNEVKYYTSTDGSSWTQLGTTITASGTTSIYNSTAEVWVGAYDGSSVSGQGHYFRAQVYDGIDGTKELDIDVHTDNSAGSQDTFTATTGQTVTLTRPTSGLKTVFIPANKFIAQTDGVDDYLALPTDCTPTFTATTGEYSFLVSLRQFRQPGSVNTIFSSESAHPRGLAVYSTAGDLVVRVGGDGGNSTRTQVGSVADGSVITVGGVVDDGLLAGYSHSDGLTTTSSIGAVGTIVHNDVRVAMRAFVASLGSDIDVFSVAVFQDALTEEELDDVSDYMESLI